MSNFEQYIKGHWDVPNSFNGTHFTLHKNNNLQEKLECNMKYIWKIRTSTVYQKIINNRDL